MSTFMLVMFGLFVMGDSMLIYALILQAREADRRARELGRPDLWEVGGTIQ